MLMATVCLLDSTLRQEELEVGSDTIIASNIPLYYFLDYFFFTFFFLGLFVFPFLVLPSFRPVNLFTFFFHSLHFLMYLYSSH